MSTAEIDRTAELGSTGRTTVIDVDGITCGHCVKQVTEELMALPNVTRVSIDLHSGEISPVTVFSDAVLDEEALRSALGEAGYDVTAVHSAA
ncbi:heavy-metal-associated domain-containing protein [Georgenia sp. SYP-B2076]|uniref:heavy-metal-associated domain-containing protein n=1 Tax=Georgenia sp. SYP-B2076 TaxID=2495881 RepID=UPI000F8CA6CB|nr:cation transporter [Georgenia sp. SYP-B2076]